MIDAVATLCIFVSDQDKAKAFYTDKLGFELRQDQPMGPDSRWIAVAPARAVTEVILYKMDGNWDHYKSVIGKSQALTFNVKDMNSTYEDFKAKGVHIVREPWVEPWGGTMMMIQDQDENILLLAEQPESAQQTD